MNRMTRFFKKKPEESKDQKLDDLEDNSGVWGQVEPPSTETPPLKESPIDPLPNNIETKIKDNNMDNELKETSIDSLGKQENNSNLQRNMGIIKSVTTEMIDAGKKVIERGNDGIKKAIAHLPEHQNDETIDKLNDNDFLKQKLKMQEYIKQTITEQVNELTKNNFNEQQLDYLANSLAKNKTFVLEIIKILQQDILVHAKKIIDNNMADVINQTKKIIEEQKQAEKQFNEIDEQLELHIKDKTKNIENLTIEITDLETQKEELTKHVDNERKTLENLTNTCNELSLKRQALNSELKSIPIELENQRQQIKEINNKIKLDNENLENLKIINNELSFQKEELINQIEQLNSEKYVKIQEIKKEVDINKQKFLDEMGEEIVNNLSNSIKSSIEKGLSSILGDLLDKSNESIKQIVDENIKKYNLQQSN